MIKKALKTRITVENNAYLIDLMKFYICEFQGIIWPFLSLHIQKPFGALCSIRNVFKRNKIGWKFTIELDKEI